MFIASVLIFFVGFLNFCVGFNIDTNVPIVYDDPSKRWAQASNQTSYFGFSVILYPGSRSNQPWILTGAPRGNNPNINRNSGICFKCGIGEKCSLFDVNAQSESINNRIKEKIDNAWIGGSMDINLLHERVVTCAPRWIKVKQKDRKDDDYRMQGSCYWFHIIDNSTQKIIPLLESDNSIGSDIYTSGGSSVYLFGQGQAGFSVHMPLKREEMILGAPGVFNWDGTSIIYKDSDESDPIASKFKSQNNRRHSRYAEATEFNYKNIGNAIETTQTLAYDLLGYSTTSGYFYKKSTLFYVSSAPRSDYRGQVLIYHFDKSYLAKLNVKETKHGEQFGEYFGASLTAGDVNGDGLDDLIVGAPFHKTRKYNEGKVYIFLGSERGRLQSQKPIGFIVGKIVGGQFGSSVQYLGDINHDGFGDVAVAAPYEMENSGVIYLFKGSANGLDTSYTQRIVGREIHRDIRGFGISISRPGDMDYNGYPDFAVGAYLSGHVVLLRSRPVVRVYQTLESFSPHIEYNKVKQFQMKACFWYELDQIDPEPIMIERTLLIDSELSRAYLESSSPIVKNITIKYSEKSCENFSVSLTGSFANYYDPISVSLSHEFQPKLEHKQTILVSENVEGIDMFCPRCPVYDKFRSLSLSMVEVPFALGCKSSKICKANLTMKPTFLELTEDNTFVLGFKSYIILQVDIENVGEKAYFTQLLITLPELVILQSIPSSCSTKNDTSYLCSVDNPLDTNSKKTVILDLDMSSVNTGKFDESLSFTLEILTNSENNGEKMKQVDIKLKREADVTINGKSEEQNYSYRNVSNGQPNFTQIYQIEKFGSSPLNEILIEINIPYILKTDTADMEFVSLYPIIGSLGDESITCNSNFTYLIGEKTISDDNVDLDDTDENKFTSKELLKRSIRQIESFNKSTIPKERIVNENKFDAFQNRTSYINCSTEQFICSKVVCSVGPVKTGQIVKIKLKMMFNVSVVKDLFGKNDVFLYATQGRVFITNPREFVQSGDRPDSFEVMSLFINGDVKNEEVKLWIIIVSVVAGLLLLLLLVLGLIKAGFFKRTTKEKLEHLKKQIEIDENQSVDTEEMPLEN